MIRAGVGRSMKVAPGQVPAESPICYSDRGGQYAPEVSARQPATMTAKPSIVRMARCYDNAPMESFRHLDWSASDANHRRLGEGMDRRYVEGHPCVVLPPVKRKMPSGGDEKADPIIADEDEKAKTLAPRSRSARAPRRIVDRARTG